jgi:hypothetical protein
VEYSQQRKCLLAPQPKMFAGPTTENVRCPPTENVRWLHDRKCMYVCKRAMGPAISLSVTYHIHARSGCSMSLLGDLIIATLVRGPKTHRVLYFFQLVPNDGGQIRLLSGLEYSFHIVIQPTNIKLMENNMCLENQIH